MHNYREIHMIQNLPKDNESSELNITAAMIAAGVKVIADEYGVCSEFVGEGLAEDVFKAMIAARQDSSAAAHAEKPARDS
jgi:hypothetical protein